MRDVLGAGELRNGMMGSALQRAGGIGQAVGSDRLERAAMSRDVLSSGSGEISTVAEVCITMCPRSSMTGTAT